MPLITQVRRGQAIKLNGDIHAVVEMNHRTPPNLRAFVQVKVRSLSNGKVSELRMTPNDNVDVVPMTREVHEYSYADASGHHFLHPETYEDVVVSEDLVEPIKNYLVENGSYELVFTDETVASIDLPPTMEMTVKDSPEGLRGDSSGSVNKPATMETGLVVQVPLFIKAGEKIKVKTDDGSYQGRA